MKTGELAKALKVDPKTIRNWIDNHGLEMLFSPSARGLDGNIHRILTEADVLALNTIHALRTEGIHDWQKIKEYLESGKWERKFPANAISAERRMISAEQAEQSLKAMDTVRERDIALAQRDMALEQVKQLEGEIERVRGELTTERKRIEALIREAAESERLREELEKSTDERKERDKRIEELVIQLTEWRMRYQILKESLEAKEKSSDQ